MRSPLILGIGLRILTATRADVAQDQPPTARTHPPGTPPQEHPAGLVHTTIRRPAVRLGAVCRAEQPLASPGGCEPPTTPRP